MIAALQLREEEVEKMNVELNEAKRKFKEDLSSFKKKENTSLEDQLQLNEEAKQAKKKRVEMRHAELNQAEEELKKSEDFS